MTPCEKLGYKVGDKFEVVGEHYAFPRGGIVTLTLDDGSEYPIFEGERTDDDTSGCCSLNKVKPVSKRAVKPISKSKRQLAQLLIEAGVKEFPEGTNWAAQDRDGWREGYPFGFYAGKPQYTNGSGMWNSHVPGPLMIDETYVATLIPNWHQTVLSRDEFDQIVAETVARSAAVGDDETNLAAKEELEALTATESPEQRAKLARIYAPTLDQLLQDWRNADDFAQRKQTEADEAAAMRDDRWQAVQARAGEMSVTVGRCEPTTTITDWRDLKVGDEVEYINGTSPQWAGRLGVVELTDEYGDYHILFRSGDKGKEDDPEMWMSTRWCSEFRFIRRP